MPTKVRLIKAMVFPVVTYGCESWAIKKAEHRRIDAFELWCWRRLLRVPWTARRSSQSILKSSLIGTDSLTGGFFIAQFSQFGCSVAVGLFATPWTAACQASLSITKSQSLLKLMSTESVMPPVVFITGATCTWATTGYIKVFLPFLIHK